MNEPKIHFAVNCASISCPKLHNKAFVGKKLQSQLVELTKEFLNDKTKNNLKNKDNVKLSKIFSWYRFDFKTDSTSIIDFVNNYIDNKINKAAKIEYLDYDWNLNK